MSNLRKPKLRVVPPLVALVLLGGFAVELTMRPRPAEAEPYHAEIRDVIDAMPQAIGAWEGEDIPIAQAAVQLLRPNRVYNRRFTHAQTGQQVIVMLVHCKDAQDIYGHYPPRCYPANGMEQRFAQPFERELDGRTIRGTEYHFASRLFGSGQLVVDNFIITPDGEFRPDMTEVRRQAWDFTRRFYGAAQVQVVFVDQNLSPHERREIFDEMVRAHLEAIETIRTGAKI